MTPPEIPSLYISPLKRNKITDTDGQQVHRCFFTQLPVVSVKIRIYCPSHYSLLSYSYQLIHKQNGLKRPFIIGNEGEL